MTPDDIWDTIMSRLGPDDLDAILIFREQAPLEWIARLASVAAKHLDTEPCERDHCDTNHQEQSEPPNAQA